MSRPVARAGDGCAAQGWWAALPRSGVRTPWGDIGVLGATRGRDTPPRLHPPSGISELLGGARQHRVLRPPGAGEGGPQLWWGHGGTPGLAGGGGGAGDQARGCGSRRGGIPAGQPLARGRGGGGGGGAGVSGKNVPPVPHHGGIPSPWRPGGNRRAIVWRRGPVPAVPGLSPPRAGPGRGAAAQGRGAGSGPGDPGAAALPQVGAAGGGRTDGRTPALLPLPATAPPAPARRWGGMRGGCAGRDAGRDAGGRQGCRQGCGAGLGGVGCRQGCGAGMRAGMQARMQAGMETARQESPGPPRSAGA